MLARTRYRGLTMVLGLALISLLAFLLAFASHSPGWMGLGILLGFICGIAAALVFIDRHLRASSRPEHMSEGEVAAVRNAMRRAGDAPKQLPPSAPG
jgi:xanthine/uracil permease